MPAGLKDELDSLPRAARAILRRILVHGPQSRTELAQTFELTLASLTRLTKPLLDHGVLAEGSAQRTPGKGRPRLPLDVLASEHLVVGVKLTGEDLYAALTDLRGDVLTQRHVPLTSTRPDTVVEAIAAVVADLGAPADRLRGLGVSLGGRTRDRSDVVRAPFLGWNDLPLASLLRQATGLPSVVDNDVVALTESLHWFGPARGHDTFAVITIGAGIGYALVVHDAIVRGAGADLSGIGNHVLDPHGPAQPGSPDGTASAYLSSEAIRRAGSAAAGSDLTYEEVMRRAEAGETACLGVVRAAAFQLGRLVAAVADIALTELIILSGEGIGLASLAPDEVERGIAASRVPHAPPVVTEIHPMGFEAWARGAAVLAVQDFVTSAADRETAPR
ncbi:ROK family transcriptional regulator [Serinibacter arcticus]|uniref:ROK family transcriptional regulator n=1 Tax=Serinibacter arcticus TaxID=1655435 RepID=UPI001305054E|nr:ROK family transcriptional regulator [Serinibacter arcticus]